VEAQDRVLFHTMPTMAATLRSRSTNIETSGDEERARISRKMSFRSPPGRNAAASHILRSMNAGEEKGHCYTVTTVTGSRTLAAYCRPDNLLRIDDTVEIVSSARNFGHAHAALHTGSVSRLSTTSSRRTSCSRRTATCASSISALRWYRTPTFSRIEGIAGSRRICRRTGAEPRSLHHRSGLYSPVRSCTSC